MSVQKKTAGRDLVMVVTGLLLLAAAVTWFAGMIAHPVSLPTPSSTPAGAESEPTVQPTIEDDAFGVALKGTALRRVVQTLQWREVGTNPLGLTDEVVREEGDYELIWTERWIDSREFLASETYSNPPELMYHTQIYGIADGADTPLALEGWKSIPSEDVVLPDNLSAVFRPRGEWLVSTPEGSEPELGDLRIRFDVWSAPVSESDIALSDSKPSGATDLFWRWLERLSAFIVAVIGAGLLLRGVGAFLPTGSALSELRAGALLAISAWIAVAAVLAAAMMVRLG